MPHKNHEDRRIWARDYYERTKDKNREHKNKRQKPINDRFRAKHKEELRQRSLMYRNENIDACRENSREYWKNHKEELNKRQRDLTEQSAPQYIKRQLRKKGFKNGDLNQHTEIVETFKIITKINRLCKTSQNSETV
jgi:phenylalanine-4-hydroxylase